MAAASPRRRAPVGVQGGDLYGGSHDEEQRRPLRPHLSSSRTIVATGGSGSTHATRRSSSTVHGEHHGSRAHWCLSASAAVTHHGGSRARIYKRASSRAARRATSTAGGLGHRGENKEIVDQFEQQTGIAVINSWRSNVTHVIANTDERGACTRTLKVLLAILAGKWVLSVNWLKACLEAGAPVPEEPYEINADVHGSFDGPRTGRLRAMQQAPSLFAGLTFYFSGHFMAAYKAQLEDLIVAAGGLILEKTGLSSTSLIVYSMEPPQGSDPDALNEVIKKRMAEAEELATTIGCKAIPHTLLLDSIASCTVLI